MLGYKRDPWKQECLSCIVHLFSRQWHSVFEIFFLQKSCFQQRHTFHTTSNKVTTVHSVMSQLIHKAFCESDSNLKTAINYKCKKTAENQCRRSQMTSSCLLVNDAHMLLRSRPKRSYLQAKAFKIRL